MKYHASILDCIGKTPLVGLGRVARTVSGKVLAKVEFLNPGQSVKDRVAAYMVAKAEERGALKPGCTLVAPTSGNTGLGLALVGRVKGYRCVFTVSDKQSQEKIDGMRAWGAEVVVCPSKVAHDHPDSYWSVAKALAKKQKGAFLLDQYNHSDNLTCHYATTGPEIWHDTEGKVTHYVAGLGTGGTVCGVGKFLKEKNPAIQVIGVDPEGSILKKYVEQGSYAPEDIREYDTEGIGSDFVPENVEARYVDTVLVSKDKEAAHMARQLYREEALFVGWSSGAAVACALRYAKEHLQKNDVMVVVLPDHGNRYLGKIYSDDWMQRQGYLPE